MAWEISWPSIKVKINKRSIRRASCKTVRFSNGPVIKHLAFLYKKWYFISPWPRVVKYFLREKYQGITASKYRTTAGQATGIISIVWRVPTKHQLKLYVKCRFWKYIFFCTVLRLYCRTVPVCEGYICHLNLFAMISYFVMASQERPAACLSNFWVVALDILWEALTLWFLRTRNRSFSILEVGQA